QHGHADAPNGAGQSEPLPESVLLRYGETTLGIALRDDRLSAQGVKSGGIVPSVSVRMRVLDRISAFKRGFHSRNGLVGVAENPEHPGHKHEHGDASILAAHPGRNPVRLLTRADHLESALERVAGVTDASHKHENHRLPSYSISQSPLNAVRLLRPR